MPDSNRGVMHCNSTVALISCRYLAGNSLICEELIDVQDLLCEAAESQSINDGVNCTTATGSVLSLSNYCHWCKIQYTIKFSGLLRYFCMHAVASGAEPGAGGGAGPAVIVGGTVGGVAVVVISLLVLVVIIFICLKAGYVCTIIHTTRPAY